jgi:hypothetical protein
MYGIKSLAGGVDGIIGGVAVCAIAVVAMSNVRMVNLFICDDDGDDDVFVVYLMVYGEGELDALGVVDAMVSFSSSWHRYNFQVCWCRWRCRRNIRRRIHQLS